MPLSFRHYKQILEDWLSYVVGHSEITDTNPGSVTRTYGEATAIEAAQIYVQLRNVLNLFSIDKSSGDDLDERAVDFGETRQKPEKSTGAITIGDSNLTTADVAVSTLAVALGTGDVILQLEAADYAAFPATGSVIVDRGVSAKRELIEYTSKTAPDKLNLATNPVYNHDLSALVYLSTVGNDRTIALGSIVKTLGSPEILFETTEAATLLDGDRLVQQVGILSIETGLDTKVAANTIKAFDSPPFPSATVTNPSPTLGGQDLESDSNFRARIKQGQQELSSSVAYLLKSAALTVGIEDTGQRVITAAVIEPVNPGEVVLYINDGTAAYSPTTQEILASEFLISIAEPAQRRASLLNWPMLAASESLYVSLDRGAATSVGTNFLADTSKAWTINAFAGWKVKDSNDQIFTVTSNTADTLTTVGNPAFGAYALFDPSATAYPSGSLLTKDVDYIINYTNGDMELTLASFPTGLEAQDALLAYYNGVTPAYTYFDGLLQKVQKTINGDPEDLDNYPGIKAAGTKVVVDTPTVVLVTVEATLSANPGIDEATIRDAVKSAIVQYINTLEIGGDVLISRLIEAALSVSGAYDITLLSPTANIIVTASQLPKTTIDDITLS